MTGNSLINLGELSKPATVLVEKISGAIGVLYEPRRIRSIARAEADAERIRAQADIEVSDLQRRAVQRWFNEEGIKQENIETITSKALPEVGADAEPERIENDWIINFFDKARLISDDEMQALWAKVLAGEANAPGTYSKRTVNYIAALDLEDAQSFAALCRFAWMLESQIPLVFRWDDTIYTEAGINTEVLSHLDDIGLIRFQDAGYTIESRSEERVIISYGDQVIQLDVRHSRGVALDLGCVRLSKVGNELAPLCRSTPVPEFLDYVLARWREDGVISSSPFPRSGSSVQGERI